MIHRRGTTHANLLHRTDGAAGQVGIDVAGVDNNKRNLALRKLPGLVASYKKKAFGVLLT